jgi:hypothetical protein
LLLARSDNSVKVRKLNFSVCGKERYEGIGYGSRGMVGGWGGTQGSYAIPFHFSIPSEALESYHGKHARIVYELEVGADMGRWKRDYHHRFPFAVINPKMDYRIRDRYYLDKKQEKKEGQPFLDMILENQDGSKESPKFRPGEVINGRLKMENTELARVRKAIIELHSIEYARWGLPRTVFDNIKKQVTYDQRKGMDINPFEIQVPQKAKRSFNAGHSEFYWLLEAKVDIDDRPDVRVNRVIQVAQTYLRIFSTFAFAKRNT